MDKLKIITLGVLQLFSGFIASALFLFASAGTLRYFNAWLLLALVFIPIVLIGGVLLVMRPDVVKKRVTGKEDNPIQIWAVRFMGLVAMSCLILSGIAYRFQVLSLDTPFVILGIAIYLIGISIYLIVMLQNKHLTRYITITEEHTVVDTGMYRIIRHPLYFALLVISCSIPLILGSILGFIAVILFPFVLAVRIINEEKYLIDNLPGYREYLSKVKYRLIPYIW